LATHHPRPEKEKLMKKKAISALAAVGLAAALTLAAAGPAAAVILFRAH
jgi:hypothetical protein